MQRALVIGSQIEGLQGVEHDLCRVSQALAARGFLVDVRSGAGATRAGILDGYAALVRDSRVDDAVVVYYSGLGAVLHNPDPRAGRLEHPDVPRTMQFIVPTDYFESTDDDYRGITSWELSLRLADLTARTHNTTVILDCCHSAQMTRDSAARQAIPRALPYPQRVGVERYLAALREQGARFERLAPEGNPHAVRLFASAESQSAWEYVGADGVPTGALTESLLVFLRELGDTPVTWDALGRAVRERVLRIFPDQRPELGGPTARALFSLNEPARTRAVPILARAGRTVLRAGQILGVRPGDVYGVMPLGAGEYVPGRRLATATVTRVAPLESEVELRDGPASGALPDGALAFPLQQSVLRFPVHVAGSGPWRGPVAAAIADAPALRVADSDEPATSSSIVVRVDENSVVIADGVSDLIAPRSLTDARATDSVAQVVELLGDLAAAQSIRDLEGVHGLPGAPVRVTWGIVVDGKPAEQPVQGALLGLGDRIFVRVDNGGAQTWYVHVFNIGVGGKVTRLTGFAALGVPLHAGQGYTLGAIDGAGLVGLGLGWPDGVPRDTPRRDDILVVVTRGPVDLGVLETPQRPIRSPLARGGAPPRDRLARLRGGTRDIDGAGAMPDGFAAVRRSFQLSPIERADA